MLREVVRTMEPAEREAWLWLGQHRKYPQGRKPLNSALKEQEMLRKK